MIHRIDKSKIAECEWTGTDKIKITLRGDRVHSDIFVLDVVYGTTTMGTSFCGQVISKYGVNDPRAQTPQYNTILKCKSVYKPNYSVILDDGTLLARFAKPLEELVARPVWVLGRLVQTNQVQEVSPSVEHFYLFTVK